MYRREFMERGVDADVVVVRCDFLEAKSEVCCEQPVVCIAEFCLSIDSAVGDRRPPSS